MQLPMNDWPRARQISLAIHTVIVTVPFAFSTVSAWQFWNSLFHDAVIASGMIVVVDMLALLGLALYVSRIASPFQSLRHVLPFVSAVPLGVELFQALASNSPWIAGTVAVIATSIMVTVAALCFRTIEQLFIDPLQAAREKAHEDVAKIMQTMERYRVVVDAVAPFRAAPQLLEAASTVLEQPALTQSQRVAAMATKIGKSESTVWRMMKKGTITLEDV